MCFNCFTGTETLVAGGVGAAGIAAKARMGIRLWLGLTTAEQRHQDALIRYETDSAFIASLGQDPALVLGAPPQFQPVRVRRHRTTTIRRPGFTRAPLRQPHGTEPFVATATA